MPVLHPWFTKRSFVISITILALVELCESNVNSAVAFSSEMFDSPHIFQYKNSIDQECHCINYNCGCCEHLEVEKIHLNNTVCVNFTYLPEDIGISFTVTIGNRTVFNETISARSPPPVCFGVPYLKEYAAICIKFYDLDVSLHKVHGCVRLEARLAHVEVGDYELGCFDISRKDFSQLLLMKKIINTATKKVLEPNGKSISQAWNSLIRKSNEIPQVLVV